MTAQEKYAKSAKGKATRKQWRIRNRDKIRKWKREWAASVSGRASARRWYKKSPKAMFSLYQQSAARRGIVFDLALPVFLSLLARPCSYCGTLPPEDSHRNGIDRIDNAQGYIEGNVTPCCADCNQMKSTRVSSVFINHVLKIARYQEHHNGFS